MNELSSDQLSTLLRIYELTCHLVHMNDQFLTQFCESIMIIASDLFVHILSNGAYFERKVICGILTYILAQYSHRTSTPHSIDQRNRRHALLHTERSSRKR